MQPFYFLCRSDKPHQLQRKPNRARRRLGSPIEPREETAIEEQLLPPQCKPVLTHLHGFPEMNTPSTSSEGGWPLGGLNGSPWRAWKRAAARALARRYPADIARLRS